MERWQERRKDEGGKRKKEGREEGNVALACVPHLAPPHPLLSALTFLSSSTLLQGDVGLPSKRLATAAPCCPGEPGRPTLARVAWGWVEQKQPIRPRGQDRGLSGSRWAILLFFHLPPGFTTLGPCGEAGLLSMQGAPSAVSGKGSKTRALWKACPAGGRAAWQAGAGS